MSASAAILSGRPARLTALLAARTRCHVPEPPYDLTLSMLATALLGQRESAARELERLVHADEALSLPVLGVIATSLTDAVWDVRLIAAETWCALLYDVDASSARPSLEHAVNALEQLLCNEPALESVSADAVLNAAPPSGAAAPSPASASSTVNDAARSALVTELRALEAQLAQGVSARLKHTLTRKIKDLQARLGPEATPVPPPAASPAAASSPPSAPLSPAAAHVQRVVSDALLVWSTDAAAWVRRHAAALLLRALLLRVAARLSAPCASRLVALLYARLVHERFGDFQADVAVLPVQETLAQALTSVMPVLPPPTLDILWQLLLATSALPSARASWQARHGAYLVLRYACALQRATDRSSAQLATLCDAAVRTLMRSDESDDVRIAALHALTPHAAVLHETQAAQLASALWSLLIAHTRDDDDSGALGVSVLPAALLSMLTALPAHTLGVDAQHAHAQLDALAHLALHRVASVRANAVTALTSLVAGGTALPSAPAVLEGVVRALHACVALLLRDSEHALHGAVTSLALALVPLCAQAASLAALVPHWLAAALTARGALVDLGAWPQWARAGVRVVASYALHARCVPVLAALAHHGAPLLSAAHTLALLRSPASTAAHIAALIVAHTPEFLQDGALAHAFQNTFIEPPTLMQCAECDALRSHAVSAWANAAADSAALPLHGSAHAQLEQLRALCAALVASAPATPEAAVRLQRASDTLVRLERAHSEHVRVVRASAACALLAAPACAAAVRVDAVRALVHALVTRTEEPMAEDEEAEDNAHVMRDDALAHHPRHALWQLYAAALQRAYCVPTEAPLLAEAWQDALEALATVSEPEATEDEGEPPSDPDAQKRPSRGALKRARDESGYAPAHPASTKRARLQQTPGAASSTAAIFQSDLGEVAEQVDALVVRATLAPTSRVHVWGGVAALLRAMAESTALQERVCTLLTASAVSNALLVAVPLVAPALCARAAPASLAAAALAQLLTRVLDPALLAVVSPVLVARAVASVSVHAARVALPLVLPALLAHLARVGERDVALRVAALRVLAALLTRLALRALPWAPLVALPCLARMSDAEPLVRRLATHCFTTLLRLLPLEATRDAAPTTTLSAAHQEEAAQLGLDAPLLAQLSEDRAFLAQLLDARAVTPYTLPAHVLRAGVTLRAYQREGISWLRFLQRYGLHGVLADDMGLGKTLQTLAIVAVSHAVQPCDAEGAHAVSLVLCPSTLVQHWCDEAQRMCAQLTALPWRGTPDERGTLLARVRAGAAHVLVVAYDVLRRTDATDALSRVAWRYLVLDEGHVLRNVRTRVAQAVRALRAQHRLLLSGTPLQNRVDDLWALFDLLMPGFLGTHTHFAATYARPIAKARLAASDSPEARAGEEALRALHRQVLPFILRREKTLVAKELPPKIVQDRFCDPSPLQRELLDALQRSSAHIGDADALVSAATSARSGSTDALKTLQYMRKLCTHPRLVLPERAELAEGSLLEHAPKFGALLSLLEECGLAVNSLDEEKSDEQLNIDTDKDSTTLPHRVLIFAQLRATLDLVEALFRERVPGLRYLRLDGTTAPRERVPLCTRFNEDASIGAMLLTTAVGGLGLNLASADTVIFLEHDWNPQKDVQAMDRAHRLTSTRTVNVYRLILRDTIEERIMGLQAFKLKLAQAVVSEDNRALATMDTERVLDMFERVAEREAPVHVEARVDEDEGQYARDFDADAFVQRVRQSQQ